MSAVFFATVLYAPQFMEKILGYSALKAGVGMVPMLGTFAIVSFFAGPAYERLGAKPTITVGALGLTIGPFLLSLVGRRLELRSADRRPRGDRDGSRLLLLRRSPPPGSPRSTPPAPASRAG